MLFALISCLMLIGALFFYGCYRVANSYALSGGYKVEDAKVIFDTGLKGLGTRQNWVVEGAHAASFVVVNKNLAKDKQQVYINGKRIEAGDGATFKHINKNWWKDKNRVYWGSTAVSNEPSNFKIIQWSGGQLFASDSKRVYQNATIIEKADPDTFKPLKRGYFVDKNHAFLGGQMLEASHGPSFRVINDHYAKDQAHVWKKGSLIEAADPDSFVPMQHPYSRDKHHIFYNYKVLSDRPAEFRILGKGIIWQYATDGLYVYHGGGKIAEADPEYFQLMGHGFALDPVNVYRGSRIIPYANPDFFEVLNEKYTHDNERVFYEDRIIEGADPHTFAVHPDISNEAKDKQGYFKSGYRSKTDYGW